MLHAKHKSCFILIVACCISALAFAQDKSPASLSATEKLASSLAAAKSDQERADLLSKGKELVTPELGKALINQGTRLRSQGDFAQAAAIYRLAGSVAERIGDKEGMGQSLINLGNVCILQANYAQASEYFRQALTLGEASGNKLGIAQAWHGLGFVHDRQGDFTQALQYYQKALPLYEALGEKVRVARMLSNIGFTYNSQGNYTASLEYCQRGLAMFEALGDRAAIAQVLNIVGLDYVYQGSYTDALACFHKSLSLIEALGIKTEIPARINNIGLAYYRQGDYARALESYQKSLALSEASGDKATAAVTLYNIGNVYTSQGDYAQALEYCQKSLALNESLGSKAEVANALNNIGDIYLWQGDYTRALEHYQRSLVLGEASGNRGGMAETTHNIGLVYLKQDHTSQALEYFRKSLALSEASGGKREIASTLGNIGAVYLSQGDHTQALEAIERATAIARQIGNRDLLWQALALAGNVYRALGKSAQARASYDEAVVTIESIRADVAGGEQEQQRFFENKVSPYQAMVKLLIAQNNASEAFAYAERAKARVLLDVLSSGRINVTKAMTGSEQEREQRANAELVSLNTQISREGLRPQPDPSRLADLRGRLQKARLEYEAFHTSLYASHPELKTQRGEAKPVTLEETSALFADANSALVEFMMTEEKTYLFVLSKNNGSNTGKPDLKVYALDIKQKNLAERVEDFRRRLASRDLGFRAPAIQLYNLLLGPARSQLQGKTSLVIVPDGALWDLPFQALRSSDSRYLLEESAISYAPSLGVLREMARARKKETGGVDASPTLLAIGNPALGNKPVARAGLARRDAPLDPLPEAEKEVKYLGQLYGADRSKVYISADAREDRVKSEAGGFKILHLATHGILNDASPMYSYIVLSQAAENANEDGFLEAWEIMKLDLKADLVVLSACETARGRVGAGEGVIGLTWALFVAGTPTTVVSQWKVDSTSTTELMLEFHRNLKARIEDRKSQTTRSGALRNAALKLLGGSQYRHPFYWAGFIVVGDGY
jgi:CHAT domain-containing protein/Tfp pilus assembly protein PilF